NKDQANGYAGLDGSGYVGNSHLGGGASDSSKCVKGDHSWGLCGSGDSTTIRYVTSDYNWSVAPTSPSSLSVGANTVTITPCPKGVDPTTTANYYVYIATTGTAEAALVTGGTACSSNSLTLTFTVAASHAAGYTVGSASSGIRDASNDARVRPKNPTGSWQTGKVIVPRREYKAYAPIYIQATNQTVDFTGAFIECYDGTKACIFVGSPTNQNSYQNITLINPKGRPMVASGTNPFIEVNAQATHIIKPLTRAPLAGNTFGYLVQVDDDESFELEGIDPSSGDALRCDATFCGVAVYGPGPFAGNSAVGWIHHSNMSMNCKGNGIEWQTGNTLKVSDSVIQGYPQFAIRGGRRGGYGGIVFDNVYTEVASGVRVKTLSTQAGELPLIPEWALGYTGVPGSGTAVLPAYIVTEDLIEYHWLTDPSPRVFQLGVSGSLASQMVVVKFGAVVVKAANYAHCEVIVNR